MQPAQSLPAVLLVDDTLSIQQLLTHTLRTVVPYEIIAVNDATAALAVVAARPVPLLITDYHLSGMRGDVLASAVKAVLPATKVMIITADIEIDGYAEWPDVDCWLIKPFPLHELLAAVTTLLPSQERAR